MYFTYLCEIIIKDEQLYTLCYGYICGSGSCLSHRTRIACPQACRHRVQPRGRLGGDQLFGGANGTSTAYAPASMVGRGNIVPPFPTRVIHTRQTAWRGMVSAGKGIGFVCSSHIGVLILKSRLRFRSQEWSMTVLEQPYSR